MYDDTRGQLLRGRTTMLKLSAAQLRAQIAKGIKREPLVWIDLGGGTGWNIERMNEFFPISDFDQVYLVDLTPSLCKVAKERFAKRGWNNVHVVCADASTFELPHLKNPEGKISLITLSYSLSMIDTFYGVIDRVKELLATDGLIGVADFYVSSRVTPANGKNGGLVQRQCNWFTRWFWAIWFDFDHINLHPCRREYLEYKFDTVKCFNGRNHFIIPYLVQIPYYVWLGCPHQSTSQIENSPEAQPVAQTSAPLTVGNVTLSPWRLPYDPTLKCHTQFDTYIYAFTWEDPREDLKVLDLKPDDEMFVITSAGDNALDYLCHADIKRIHCIDMNPHQNHLLELKLAAITALPYEDFWKMFGMGRHEDFANILDSKLSPHMSSPSYQYWKANSHRFLDNFFKSGCSGYALNLIRYVVKLLGKKEAVQALCKAKTLEEQIAIWEKDFRPALLNKWFIRMLDNPAFLWTALGVPINQFDMLLAEGTSHQYITDTLDPIIHRSLLADDQYFYLLCLLLHYTKESCPSYVSETGFRRLKNSGILDTVRLHTSSIIKVLESLEPNTLTKVILMDHMDWFNEKDATDEIKMVHRTVKQGGYVFWRSSARQPWYNEIFTKVGFKVEAVAVRKPGTKEALDRVNMYASFYKATKL